jgi:hypothetical protein
MREPDSVGRRRGRCPTGKLNHAENQVLESRGVAMLAGGGDIQIARSGTRLSINRRKRVFDARYKAGGYALRCEHTPSSQPCGGDNGVSHECPLVP